MTPASQISIIISAISMILSAALGMIFVLGGISTTVLAVYTQAFGISLN